MENVQRVSDIIGGWGPFQRRLMFLLCVCYCAAPFNNKSFIFYLIKSGLWCENPSGARVVIEPEYCSFKDLDKCIAWGHNTTRGTLIKEWNIVCENNWQRSLVLPSYQIGYLISGPLVGLLSDKFGRKTAIIGCTMSEIICSILLYLSTSIEMFAIVRIFHGIGGYGRYLASLILLTENVDSNSRGRVVVSFDWIWFGGECMMIIVAYFVSNFRHIYLGSAIFQLFCLVIVIPRITESIRWQLVNGQESKAEKTLRKHSVAKGLMDEATFQTKFVSLRDNLRSSLKANANRESIISLYRHSKTRNYCCALYVIWLSMFFNLQGLTYITIDLSGDIFINNLIFAFSGIAALIFMTWKIERFKRRNLLFILCLFASLTLFTSIPLSNVPQYFILRTWLLIFGKFFAAAILLLLYVYSVEFFPTSLRHFGVGTCSTVARAASISAPFIAQFVSKVDLRITLGLFTILGLIGAATSITLPETKGKEITDTVDELIKRNSESYRNRTSNLNKNSF